MDFEDSRSVFESSNELNEEFLHSSLSRFFGSLINYESSLKINGILSFSIDQKYEKFVKVNLNLEEKVQFDLNSTDAIDTDQNNSKHSSSSENAINVIKSDTPADTALISEHSPPTITSYAIPHSFDVNTRNFDLKPINTSNSLLKLESELSPGTSTKRDRRKCKRPKRQAPNTNIEKNQNNPTTGDEPVAKLPRTGKKFTPQIDVDEPSYTDSDIMNNHTTSKDSIKISTNSLTMENLTTAAMEFPDSSVLSVQNRIDSSESYRHDDNVDTDDILPITSLVDDSISSQAPNNYEPNVGVSKSDTPINVDIGTQLGQNGSSVNSGVLLNPSLAAALAAALSGVGNQSFQSTDFNGQIKSQSSIQSSLPSLAVTNQTGELLGTIPLGSVLSNQRLINTAQTVQLSSTSASTSVTPLSSLSISTKINQSPTNTISYLRSPQNLEIPININNQPTNTSGHQTIVTGNTTALLQSLANQSNLSQLISNGLSINQTSSSLCPTLALIGTVGKNSPHSNSNSSAIIGNQSSPQPSGNTLSIAAALLRGLAASKNNISDNEESNVREISNSISTPRNIVNSQISNESSTSDIIKTPIESSLCNLANIINARAVNSIVPPATPLNIPENEPVSVNGTSTITNRSINVPHSSLAVIPNAVRNSIMLSYPRNVGEMNLLLAPTSNQNLQHSLNSIGNIPVSALSLNNLNASNQCGITLASPVLVKAPITTIAGSNSTSTTSVTSPVISISIPLGERNSTSKLNQQSISTCSKINKNDNIVNCPITSTSVDSTTTTIDRILQTIKGCMNSKSIDDKSKNITPRRSGNINKTCVKSVENNSPSFAEIRPHSVILPNSSIQALVTPNDEAKRVLLPQTSNDTENSPDSDGGGPIRQQFGCRYCGKRFNRKFCRERHERLHTGIKPYTCEMCDEKFIRLEDKKRHVRSLQHSLAHRSSSFKNTNDLIPIRPHPKNTYSLLAQTLQNNHMDQSESVSVEELTEHMVNNHSDGASSINESNPDKDESEVESEDCSSDHDLNHTGDGIHGTSCSSFNSESIRESRSRDRSPLKETQFKSAVIPNVEEVVTHLSTE